LKRFARPAQSLGLAVHDLTAVQQAGQLFIELHLEVDENLSLREAHRQATELEEKIRELRYGHAEVNIHIEPLGRHIATPDAGIGGDETTLDGGSRSSSTGCRRKFDELVNCHDVRARQVEHHILVSCHCTMKGALPITQIHDVTAALEDRVKERFSANLSRHHSPRTLRRKVMAQARVRVTAPRNGAQRPALPARSVRGKQTRT